MAAPRFKKGISPLVVIAIAFALFVLARVILFTIDASRQRQARPAPNIDALKAALEKSAEKTLAAPGVANEKIELSIEPAQMGEESERIADAALQSGGSAVKSYAPGRVDVLARIPREHVAQFRELVTGSKSAASPESSEPNLLIDVVITGVAAK